MTLKGCNVPLYANRVVLWLNGTWYGVSDGTVATEDGGNFLLVSIATMSLFAAEVFKL